MKLFTAALAASAALIGSASATPLILDFESLSEGTAITTGNTPGASSITVTDSSAGTNAGTVVAYDTGPGGSNADLDLEQPIAPAPISGPDDVEFSTSDNFSVLDADDLPANAFAGLGNIGIFQNNATTAANDDPSGGILNIALDGLQIFESIDFVDLNSSTANAVTVTLTLADMVSTVAFEISGFDTDGSEPENFAARVIADVDYLVSSIQIEFLGSGAFDNVTFSEVPLPGAVWLMIAGLAGLRLSTKAKAN